MAAEAAATVTVATAVPPTAVAEQRRRGFKLSANKVDSSKMRSCALLLVLVLVILCARSITKPSPACGCKPLGPKAFGCTGTPSMRTNMGR